MNRSCHRSISALVLAVVVLMGGLNASVFGEPPQAQDSGLSGQAARRRDSSLKALFSGDEKLVVSAFETGRLQEVLDREGGLYTQSLTIKGGALNAADTYAIRDSLKNLVVLDLARTSLVNNSVPDQAFKGMAELREVLLPDDLEAIRKSAFQDCNKLGPSIALPQSLEIIETGAFSGCGLERILLPGDISSVGNGAFSGSPITEVTIESAGGMSNFKDAFSGVAVKRLTLADTVTTIPAHAFQGCASLQEVNLPISIRAVEDDAFQGCTALEKVTLPPYIGSIGDRAFSGCPLTTVAIPDAVTSIGEEAFEGCPVSDLYLPAGINHVGDRAFRGCKIDRLTMKNDLLVSGFSNYFSGAQVKEIELRKGVTGIPTGTFQGMDEISKVTLADTVTSIGEEAFQGCTGLTDVNLPENVTVGDRAFQGCGGLTEIEIPANVAMGEDAFGDCDGLKSVTVADGGTLDDFSKAFTGSTVIHKVDMGAGVDSIPDRMFAGNADLKEVVIPESVTAIGKEAFQGCGGLTEIEIPANVTLGIDAFKNCAGLKSVTLTDNTSLQGFIDAFTGTTAIQTVKLGTGVSTVPDSVFAGRATLREVSLPASLTTIGRESFQGCTSLTSLTLPSQLTSVGERAFSGSALTSLAVPGGVTVLPYGVLEGCSGLQSVTLSEGLREIGQSAFQNCGALTGLDLPGTLTRVGPYAVDGCTSLIRLGVAAGDEGIAAWDSAMRKLAAAGAAPTQLVRGNLNRPDGTSIQLDNPRTAVGLWDLGKQYAAQLDAGNIWEQADAADRKTGSYYGTETAASDSFLDYYRQSKLSRDASALPKELTSQTEALVDTLLARFESETQALREHRPEIS